MSILVCKMCTKVILYANKLPCSLDQQRVIPLSNHNENKMMKRAKNFGDCLIEKVMLNLIHCRQRYKNNPPNKIN